MSKNSSFKAAHLRQASERATTLTSSHLPTVKVLLRNANITRPVDVARALKGLGLSLRNAHHVLDRLAEGKDMPAELDARAVETDGLDGLLSLGVVAHRIAPPPPHGRSGKS